MARQFIKRFEVFLGSQFYAWVADDKTEIFKSGQIVKVIKEDDEHGKITTTFDLDLTPVYTIA